MATNGLGTVDRKLRILAIVDHQLQSELTELTDLIGPHPT
jgi:hypothetical protein